MAGYLILGEVLDRRTDAANPDSTLAAYLAGSSN
jgi:hypothetical protein